MWIAIIKPKGCPTAYVGLHAAIVWVQAEAQQFPTHKDALDAATEASFDGEEISAIFIDEPK